MKYIFLYILACLFTVNAVAQRIKPTVAVLGDSYSTFEKYIPDTNKRITQLPIGLRQG